MNDRGYSWLENPGDLVHDNPRDPHVYIYTARGNRTLLAQQEGKQVKENRIVKHAESAAARWWSQTYRVVALSMVFAMVFGGLVLSQQQIASAESAATVTESLYLRSGPGTDSSIILVMPAGAAVSVTGDPTNGFYPLTYRGTSGYAHSDWISFGGSTGSGTTSSDTGTAYVIDGNLNLRTGPSTGNSVITIMPNGAMVSLTGQSSGGFLSVAYNGTAGWAYADYLSSSAPSQPTTPTAPSAPGVGDTVVSTMRTTANLNMRSGPGTGYGVIATAPNGTAVEIMGDPQNGFYPGRYNGSKGWMHADWLTSGGTSLPQTPTPTTPSAPSVGDTVVSTMRTTANLNMRSGPGTGYGVVSTAPSGSAIEIMGDPQNGFYPVRYNGSKGWMHGDWLTSGGTSLPQNPTPTPTPTTPSAPSVGDTAVGTMRTTVRLNIRTGPGADYSVITTLVIGATVEIMGSQQNGYYPVRYGQTKGWMMADFLTSEGAGTPGPASEAPIQNPNAPDSVAVGDTVVGTRTVAVGLNLRQGPGANYNVILIMPGGATVSIMGDQQNGYYPVTFHGTKGWASASYLTTGSANVPNPGGNGYTRDEIIQIIYAAADKYGQPRADMLRVAQCESVLDPSAVNPASGVSGLFQFLPSTWRTTPYANQDIFDPVANANAAAWMWSVGRRNEWHCQ